MSFFDKLKIKDNPINEKVNEDKEIKTIPTLAPKPNEDDLTSVTKKIVPVTEEEEISSAVGHNTEEEKKKKWFEAEGQLAIDLYQTASDFVVQTAIAGINPKDLEIIIEKDTVVIRGRREKPQEAENPAYFYQECYWGPFSREIILPQEVDTSSSQAEMKNGILTIKVVKIDKEKRKISVKID